MEHRQGFRAFMTKERHISIPATLVGAGIVGVSVLGLHEHTAEGERTRLEATSSVDIDALAGMDHFINHYGCSAETISVSAVDLPDDIGALGRTSQRGVEIDVALSGETAFFTGMHEAVHACADIGRSPHPHMKILLHETGYGHTSSGFVLRIPNDTETIHDDQHVYEIEEGVTSWIVRGEENAPAESAKFYKGTSELTARLAELNGFTRHEVVRLHQRDDILGFIALVNGSSTEEITPNITRAIFGLYIQAGEQGSAPALQEIQEALSTG